MPLHRPGRCAIDRCRKRARQVVFGNGDPYETLQVCDDPAHRTLARRRFDTKTTALPFADYTAANFPRPERSFEREYGVGIWLNVSVYGTEEHVAKAVNAIVAEVALCHSLTDAEYITTGDDLTTVNIADAVYAHEHGGLSGAA